MDGTWVVPFRGRNHSGACQQNFLWRQGRIYVMDNHRAALWCWLQELDPKAKHSILHIDRHTDALQSRLNEWLDHLPSSWALGADEYLEHSYRTEAGTVPVFRWDNYLSIYLALFGPAIDRIYITTPLDGDHPNFPGWYAAEMRALPTNIDYWISAEHGPWIVNVDLDYFFCECSDGCPAVMCSDAYLFSCFEGLRRKIREGVVSVLTLSLTPSPELTGGWELSEGLATKVLGYMGVDFRLPE